MALNLEQIKMLVESGEIEPYLQRFIQHALSLHVERLITKPETVDDDMAVAAMALWECLQTPSARKRLRLEPKTRGKFFEAKDYFERRDVMSITGRYHEGMLDEPAAIGLLYEAVKTPAIEPDRKTIKRLLLDLEEQWCMLMSAMDSHIEAGRLPLLTTDEISALADKFWKK